jgi:hypothetical protein
MDNLPHLRMSDAQLKVILWIMRETGSKDVPSFSSFRKSQSALRKQSAIRTHPYKSSLGNIFYTNDIADSIAKVCQGFIFM